MTMDLVPWWQRDIAGEGFVAADAILSSISLHWVALVKASCKWASLRGVSGLKAAIRRTTISCLEGF